MAVVPPPRDRFFNNLTCMKEPLVKAIKQLKGKSTLISPELVETAFAFLSILPRQELLDTFIKRTSPHWELISGTEDVSVILDAVLGGFKELGDDKIDEIKRIVKDKQVDSAIQDELLKLGKSLVRIGIRELEASSDKQGVDVDRMLRLYSMTKA